jgi:hypothetical protein
MAEEELLADDAGRKSIPLGQIKSDIDPASKSIGRSTMMRTFSAMAIAGLVLVAVAGISQAAPIAPLPAGVMADHSFAGIAGAGGATGAAGIVDRCGGRDLLLRYPSDHTVKIPERKSIQSEAILS